MLITSIMLKTSIKLGREDGEAYGQIVINIKMPH